MLTQRKGCDTNHNLSCFPVQYIFLAAMKQLNQDSKDLYMFSLCLQPTLNKLNMMRSS